MPNPVYPPMNTLGESEGNRQDLIQSNPCALAYCQEQVMNKQISICCKHFIRNIPKDILVRVNDKGCGKKTFKYTNQKALRIMFLHVFLPNG
jgi:hypothetical protein